MKKIALNILRTYIVFFFICSTVAIMLDFIPYPASQHKNVFFIGNVSAMDYLLFSYQYNRLPEITKDSFTDSSWNFYISKGEVKSKSKPPEYDLSGYCSYEEEKIWAEIDIDDFGTVIHEFGHFADCKNNFVSLQTEWKQIWNKEKEKISEYAMKNEIEGLAEAFEQAYLYGAAFKIKCPQSYNFIIRTFGEAQ